MIRFVSVITEGPWPGEQRFKRKHNAAMKAGHQLMGLHWIRGGIREAHFRPSAHAMYGYAMRSTRYQAAKRRKTGRNLDLVYTGESMRQSGFSRVLPTAQRALMKIPAGRYNFRPGGLDMRDELTRLTVLDVQALQSAFFKMYRGELAAQRERDYLTVG